MLIFVCLAIENSLFGLHYPFLKDYQVIGVDVSHHQKDIDWSKIKKEGVQFAFIKATEGANFKDKSFLINVKNAKKENIDIGAYHFFTFCKSAEEQFVNFNESINAIALDLPPVIDFEFVGNCTLNITKDEVRAKIDSLSVMLEKKYLRKPIYYFTYKFINYFYQNEKIKNPIWIRDIDKKPTLMNGNQIVFWQFSNRGKIEGIRNSIDFNVFWGSKEDYKKFKDK